MVTSLMVSIEREIKKFFNLIKKPYGSLKNRNSIAANIICYNNIKSIESCLKSLENAVDEIIVVDGASNDGTIEILEKYNCKIIIEKEWKGYAFKRNLALANTKADWIFKIDSDEALSSKLKNNLKTLCSSEIFYAYKIYSKWLVNYDPENLEESKYIYKSKSKGIYYVPIRLFRNIENISWKGEIHEYISGLEEYYKKRLDESLSIYHYDVIINDFQERFKKVIERNKICLDAGHAEEYLPELYNNPEEILPKEDLENLSFLKTLEHHKTLLN